MSEIINFYELEAVKELAPKTHNPNYKSHGIKLPFRIVAIGASGSGKTNIIMNIIQLMNNSFNKIILYTRNADEPLYNYLRKKIPEDDFLEIHEGLEHLNTINMDTYFFGQTFIIFDDICNEKDQSRINELYLRGRKLGGDKHDAKAPKGVSLIYLTQKYSFVPTLVREQVNYLILKKISGKRDILSILRNHSLSLEKEILMKIYQYCVSDNVVDFLLIDLNEKPEKAYRKGFNKILNIEYFLK